MRLIVCLMLSLMPGFAIAEVTVRTGEHADFSRIVLTIPAGAGWRLGRTDAGYGIAFDDDQTVDLTGFFDRIPRDRIQDATLSDNRKVLDLSVTCACNATAFLWRPDKLVVDIRSGAPDPASPFETPFGPTSTELSQDESLTIGALPDGPTGLPDWLLAGPSPEHDGDAPAGASDRAIAVDALEAEVLATLARAASQGLLVPAGTTLAPVDTVVVAEEPVDEIATFPQDSTPPTPGIRVQSSIDLALDGLTAANVTQAGDSCWPDTWFAIDTWVASDSFQMEIGPLRTAITQEFDKINPDDVLALARAYVFFGFGREARQVLTLSDERSPAWFAVVSLAQVVDGDPVQPAIPQGQMACENSVALWAFLAADPRDSSIDTNVPAVLRAFRALPLHLQNHLAPRASQAFVDMGDLSAAEAVLTNLRRAPEPTVPAVLADVQIDLARGNDMAAASDLKELAEDSARITPQALVDLMRLNQSNGIATPADMLALAAAHRFENAGLPMAADLGAAEVQAHIALSDFDKAAATLSEIERDLDPSRLTELREIYAASLTAIATDGEFLEFAFAPIPDALRPETENAIAGRLIQLGFPDRASGLLSGPAIGAAMAERRYLRARAAVETGGLDRVEGILAGVTTPRANAIRRDVAARSNGFQVSDEIPVDSRTPPDAWRSGLWQDLSATDDSLLQAATTLVLQPQPVPSDAAPLAEGAALLDQSAETRDVIAQLLSRFPLAAAEATPTN